jgi:hypothetical protein
VLAIDGGGRDQGVYPRGVRRGENAVKENKKVKEVKEKPWLLAELSKKPEEERKTEAEKETGDDREVEGGVFAAVDDVAGEAAEAQRKFSAKVKKSADKDGESAENEEGAAEFAKRVHAGILPEPAKRIFPPRTSVS